MTANFHIDQVEDPSPLMPVNGDVPATVEATYEIDSDGIIHVCYAAINLGGRQVDLDLKDDRINDWLKKGCEWHLQITRQDDR
mgnify:CR=1 FL=1